MAELAYERFSGAFEDARGTAKTAPDWDLGITGTLDPAPEYKSVDQYYGLLASSTDEDILVRATSTWAGDTGDGGASTTTLPRWANLALKGGVTAPQSNNKLVASTTVTAGGSGYTTPPTVTPSGGTPLVPASFLAVLTGDAVTAITVVNPGEGYASAPTLALSGGGGAGATATATLATPTTAQLWQFPRTLTSDDLESLTLFWGDPNVQILRSAFGMLQTLDLDGDASGTDLVKLSAAGIAYMPTEVSAPTFPAAASGAYLRPKSLALWIDPATGNFGDTAITGRVVSATLHVETGVTPKFLAEGPGGALNYTRVGRAKTAPTLTVVLEFLDPVQYDLAMAAGGGVRQKVRARWYGPLIETTGGWSFYHFCEVDLYGRLAMTGWGDLEGTNRTLELTITGSYLPSAATDLTLRVQNASATL